MKTFSNKNKMLIPSFGDENNSIHTFLKTKNQITNGDLFYIANANKLAYSYPQIPAKQQK